MDAAEKNEQVVEGEVVGTGHTEEESSRVHPARINPITRPEPDIYNTLAWVQFQLQDAATFGQRYREMNPQQELLLSDTLNVVQYRDDRLRLEGDERVPMVTADDGAPEEGRSKRIRRKVLHVPTPDNVLRYIAASGITLVFGGLGALGLLDTFMPEYAKQQIQQHEAQVAATAQEMQNLLGQLQDSQRRHNETRAQLGKSEKELITLTRQSNQFEGKLAGKGAEVTSLKKEITRLRGQLGKSDSEIVSMLRDRIKTLNVKNDELLGKNNRWEAQLAMLRPELSQSRQQVADLGQQLDNKNTELAQLTSVVQESRVLQSKLSSVENRLAVAERVLSDVREHEKGVSRITRHQPVIQNVEEYFNSL